MPLLARIDAVIQQIAMGRRTYITIGEALDKSKCKIRIRLALVGEGVISDVVAQALIAILR